MSAITQRDHVISILDLKLTLLSKLYKECYLSIGRGALLIYAQNVIKRGLPILNDYRTKEEILDMFDNPASHEQLAGIIDNYDQKNEGVLVLVTSFSNATFFVTVKLK